MAMPELFLMKFLSPSLSRATATLPKRLIDSVHPFPPKILVFKAMEMILTISETPDPILGEI